MKTKHIVIISIPCQSTEELQKAKVNCTQKVRHKTKCRLWSIR